MEGLPETKEGIEQFLHDFLPGGNTRGEWAVGNSKIFFRDLLLTKLQKKLEEMFEGQVRVSEKKRGNKKKRGGGAKKLTANFFIQAMLMQARIRAWHAIRKTEQLREMAMNSLILKRHIRKFHAENLLEKLRREYEEKVRCTTIVQKNVRKYHAACTFLQLKAEHESATGMAKYIRR